MSGALQRAALATLFAVVGLAGCSDGYVRFPVTDISPDNLPENVEVIRLDESNIDTFSRPARGHVGTNLPSGRNWTYFVGPGDILSVIVFNHAELTLPAGPQRSAEESGFLVRTDGRFTYPFIGEVQAHGRLPEQIREDIETRLEEFIPDPQVDVRVAAYNSQSVVVSGQVGAPNRQALTAVPLTLIEAVNAAGGFTDDADLRAVSVQRSGRLYTVDMQGFLSGGIVRNNPVLRNGDVVNVPRRRAEEAYLLGEVARPNVIDLSIEPITLTQAVTRLGGLSSPRADARRVLVFPPSRRENARVPTGYIRAERRPDGARVSCWSPVTWSMSCARRCSVGTTRSAACCQLFRPCAPSKADRAQPIDQGVGMFKSVLVVCVGNICRSPLGERMLRTKLAEAGSDVVVTSAGIAALVDHAADETATEVAAAHGVSLDGHKARQFTAEIGMGNDLILVMEPGHKHEISRIAPAVSGRVMLFDQWVGGKGIADPYRLSREFHEEVFKQVAAASDAWVKRIAPRRP
ncbi:MAG: polysaccharide biosynthesis/export family protein [Paracoccaceae bacterium]